MASSREANRRHVRHYRERLRARLSAAESVRLSDELLRKINVDARLSDDEEKMLEVQLDEAKKELYRQRGGADAALQRAVDFGEELAE